MVCTSCPVLPLECQKCNNLICFRCHYKLAFKNGCHEKLIECFECKWAGDNDSDKSAQDKIRSDGLTPGVVYRPIQNKIMKKLVDDTKVDHVCGAGRQPKRMTMKELDTHLTKEQCQSFLVPCSKCTLEFRSVDKLTQHLQHDCPNVLINCLFCSSCIPRDLFNSHPCR